MATPQVVPRFQGVPSDRTAAAIECERLILEAKRIRRGQKVKAADEPVQPSNEGVLFQRSNGRWRSWINEGGKQVWLGVFLTRAEAREARKEALAARMEVKP
jgi:hypothetical protein